MLFRSASLRPRPPVSGGGRGSEMTALLPEGRWRIDRDHSSVNFAVTYLGVTKVRGRFMDLQGAIESADDRVAGEASVATGSVQTGSAVRDRHLQSADFLNAEEHPRLVFALGDVREVDRGLVVAGHLTLNGVTRDVAFAATPGGTARDAYGHDREIGRAHV